LKCPTGQTLHCITTTNDDEPLALEQRHGNEACDEPAYAGAQGQDASVESSGAGQWPFLGRAELAPSDGLPVVVDENSVSAHVAGVSSFVVYVTEMVPPLRP
jgi:hypothetical protein